MEKGKLLLVDDDAHILTMLKFLFGTKGYDILVTDNAREAIKIAHSENPDAIILDIKMPGMDGCEFIKKTALMNKINDIPIVVLTATGTAHKTCLLSQGICDYIEKPFHSSDLMKVVESAIKQRGVLRKGR